jgi:hypothetical protein
MTALLVLYAPRTGQTLGAVTTTVPGDRPSLDGLTSLRVSVPIPDLTKPTLPPPPRPLTVARDDLAIAQVEAEFDDPLKVFDWRVLVETAPDGTRKPRLDRLSTGVVDATRQGTTLTLVVPRLGNTETLAFEVRDTSGLIKEGRLTFASGENTKTHPVTVPEVDPLAAMVTGYAPVVAKVVPVVPPP